MTYSLVVDSCCDLVPEKKADPHFQVIPLTLEVGGRTFIDDDFFDQKEYLRAVAEASDCPKTACPSPEAYMKAFACGADMIFVFTLSAHLSGSYNSALLGKGLYEEEYGKDGKTRIHVFSSDSACCGEANEAFYCQELIEAGASFEEIVEKTEEYIHSMRTYFVLESLETLRKNGRLTGLAAILATTLNIKPVMSAEGGVIIKLGQARGLEKALKSMVDHVCRNVRDAEKKRIAITHVNCPERAEKVKAMLQERLPFREFYIVDAAGVSSTYACDGGIVVAV